MSVRLFFPMWEYRKIKHKSAVARQRFLVMSLRLMLFVTLSLFFSGCQYDKEKGPKTITLTPENAPPVYELLKEAGLCQVDVFEKWVVLSSENHSKALPKSTEFTDANCRMTVILLTGDRIQTKGLEKDYKGDYLMFDLEAIDHNDAYGALENKKKLLTTLFGEMPIPDAGFSHALADQWNKFGIQVNSKKYSIISVLFKVYGSNEAFVGHTGIFIDCRDKPSLNGNYLFLEKIAFGEPFQITWLENENELIDLLSKRSDYIGEEGDPLPVVYKNKEKIGILKTLNNNIKPLEKTSSGFPFFCVKRNP